MNHKNTLLTIMFAKFVSLFILDIENTIKGAPFPFLGCLQTDLSYIQLGGVHTASRECLYD